jgi:hypothetical protein
VAPNGSQISILVVSQSLSPPLEHSIGAALATDFWVRLDNAPIRQQEFQPSFQCVCIQGEETPVILFLVTATFILALE